jgi:hypothetical protein
MKNKYYKAKSGNLYFFIIIAIMFMTRCEDTPDTLPVKDIELQITTYMEAHPDKYSEFLKAVIKVELQHLFKRSVYTVSSH